MADFPMGMMMMGPGGADVGVTVIVNYVPDELSEAQFAALFAEFAPMNVKLVMDKSRRCSLGYGFLVFATREAADVCINRMNGAPVMSKRLKVTLAKPREEVRFNSNVYIAGIPPGWTEELMRAVAAPFGDIIEHRLMPPQAGHTTLSGFVRFSRRLESDAAITALHGLPVAVDGPLLSPTDPMLAVRKREYVGQLGVFHLTARYASDARTRQKERGTTFGTPGGFGHTPHQPMHASGVPMHVVMAAMSSGGPATYAVPPTGFAPPYASTPYPAAPAYASQPAWQDPAYGADPYYGSAPGYPMQPSGGPAYAYDAASYGRDSYGTGSPYSADPSGHASAMYAHGEAAMPGPPEYSGPMSGGSHAGSVSPASGHRSMGMPPTGAHPPRAARTSGPPMLMSNMRVGFDGSGMTNPGMDSRGDSPYTDMSGAPRAPGDYASGVWPPQRSGTPMGPESSGLSDEYGHPVYHEAPAPRPSDGSGMDDIHAHLANLALTMSDPMPSRRLNYLTQQNYRAHAGEATDLPMARGTGGRGGMAYGAPPAHPGVPRGYAGAMPGIMQDWRERSSDTASMASSHISLGHAQATPDTQYRNDSASVATLTAASTVNMSVSVMTQANATSAVRGYGAVTGPSMAISPGPSAAQHRITPPDQKRMLGSMYAPGTGEPQRVSPPGVAGAARSPLAASSVPVPVAGTSAEQRAAHRAAQAIRSLRESDHLIAMTTSASALSMLPEHVASYSTTAPPAPPASHAASSSTDAAAASTLSADLRAALF